MDQSYNSKSVLLIIDMQNGLFKAKSTPYNHQFVLSNILKLINYHRSNNKPIIFVRHVGEKDTPLDPDSLNTQLITELSCNPDKDIVIEKTYPSSFKHTVLKELLEKLDIDEIIVTGMKTEYCIDTTIRAASEFGYKLTLISDAHTTFDSTVLDAQHIIDHHNQVLNNAFAKVKTTEEFIH
ncbi:cysteine hydrolase family protein [Acinetobacter nosocomialis]|uniref:cysteine hydrolase family protein n=1 Tax=Acinetobacter nosocomialis TaxID=106654 RepID=UPI001250770E|nr:cysteine hydrolase family protein [Acinetobacter nosocomialis]ELA7466683.1 cysteine hydrolase [Acinetobacter nosocomialis]MDO7209903.1 cysteine hydrolase family protein [Acinetobacter nosocomialis]